MDGPGVELPRYQCHKKVHAAKITSIKLDQEGYRLDFGEDGAYQIVSSAWVNKNSPFVGGYYVVYEDGYRSYSPAKAFEEGYTRLTKS